jgi:integration host factor subunit beta
MNRSDLVALIASKWYLLNTKDVEASVATILSAIAGRLAEGGRAEIRGFGSFWVHQRPPRTARNPKTGAAVSVPSKRSPHFKPGTDLRKRVTASATATTAKSRTEAKGRKVERVERVV